MLPDRLTVPPIARFRGTLVLPGSKSLSNRILLLSALAEGETEVTRVLDSEDTEVMLSALCARSASRCAASQAGAAPCGSRGKAGPLNAPGAPNPSSCSSAMRGRPCAR